MVSHFEPSKNQTHLQTLRVTSLNYSFNVSFEIYYQILNLKDKKTRTIDVLTVQRAVCVLIYL